MRGELSRTTKLFQLELRLANQIGRITFLKLIISLFDVFIAFQYFLFPKTFGYELRDSRGIQGFVLIYEQSCMLYR